MIDTYYCIETEVFETFMNEAHGKTVILISDLSECPENSILLITQECKRDLSDWKGMILFA